MEDFGTLPRDSESLTLFPDFYRTPAMRRSASIHSWTKGLVGDDGSGTKKRSIWSRIFKPLKPEKEEDSSPPQK